MTDLHCFKLSTGLGGGITLNRKIMNNYQPSGAGGTRSLPAESKMADGIWALRSTFAK